MRKLLQKLDIFADKPNLRINGQETFRTSYGVLIAALYFASLVGVSVRQLMSYWDFSSPLTTGESFTRQNYPKVDLVKNRLIPVFIFYSTETDFIPIDQIGQYFTITAKKIIWASAADGSGVDVEKHFEDIGVKPCSQLTPEELSVFDYMLDDGYVYNAMKTYGMCPIPSDKYFVEGKGSDNLFQLISVSLKPCSLPTGCRTHKEMQKANFQVFMPTTSVNTSNYENHQNFSVSADDVYYINPRVRQIYTSKVKEMQIVDYIGTFPAWKMRTSYFEISSNTFTQMYRDELSVSCTVAQLNENDTPNCLSYFEFTVQSSGEVQVNKRTYNTLEQTLGNIGGLNAILSLVALILYSRINEKKRRDFLLKQIYGEEVLNYPEETIFRYNRRDNTNANEAKTVTKRIRGFCADLWLGLMPCLRKLSKHQAQHEIFLRLLEKRMYKALDMESIIKSNYLVEIMSKILLDPRHIWLSPMVDFKIWLKKHQDIERILIETGRPKKTCFGNKHYLSEEYKPLNYSTLYGFKESIVMNHSKSEHEAKIVEPSIHAMADNFYARVLGYSVQDAETQSGNKLASLHQRSSNVDIDLKTEKMDVAQESYTQHIPRHRQPVLMSSRYQPSRSTDRQQPI